MAFFPEFLYQLSERDQALTWLEPVLHVVDVNAAAASLEARYVIPNDRALLLQHAAILVAPQATLISTLRILELMMPVSETEVVLKRVRLDGAVAQSFTDDWQGSILVPPSWIIRAFGSFNGALANNEVALFIIGMLMPVGGIVRV